MISLFVYGTLTSQEILTSLIGRKPLRTILVLEGYKAIRTSLPGWTPFPILIESCEDTLQGYVVEVTEKELKILDRFENIDSGLFYRGFLTTINNINVETYFPSNELVSKCNLSEEWLYSDAMNVIDIYTSEVIPAFKKEHKDVYEC